MTSTVSPLRAFRIEKLQISAQDAADQLGMHKATYCRLEVGGPRMPKKEHLRAVSKWLRKNKSRVTLDQVLFPEDHAVTIRLSVEPAARGRGARARGARVQRASS